MRSSLFLLRPNIISCQFIRSLLRCEAAYYFPKDMDVCHAATPPSTAVDKQEEPQFGLAGTHDKLSRREMVEASPANEGKRGQGARSEREAEGGGGAGTLVLHVRSGDIFDDKVISYYGQVRYTATVLASFSAILIALSCLGIALVR